MQKTSSKSSFWGRFSVLFLGRYRDLKEESAVVNSMTWQPVQCSTSLHKFCF